MTTSTEATVFYMLVRIRYQKRAGLWYFGDGKPVRAKGLRQLLREIDAKLRSMEWVKIGDEILEFVDEFSDEQAGRDAMASEAAKRPDEAFRLFAAADLPDVKA